MGVSYLCKLLKMVSTIPGSVKDMADASCRRQVSADVGKTFADISCAYGERSLK